MVQSCASQRLHGPPRGTGLRKTSQLGSNNELHKGTMRGLLTPVKHAWKLCEAHCSSTTQCQQHLRFLTCTKEPRQRQTKPPICVENFGLKSPSSIGTTTSVSAQWPGRNHDRTPTQVDEQRRGAVGGCGRSKVSIRVWHQDCHARRQRSLRLSP
jgi:hypothetical protein